MSRRKTTAIISILSLVALVGIFSNQHSRWFVLYGLQATEFSNRLLLGQQTETPYWAFDLVVVSDPKNNIVTYSQHLSGQAYAYSPNNKPVLASYSWVHLVGSWYVGKIKLNDHNHSQSDAKNARAATDRNPTSLKWRESYGN